MTTQTIFEINAKTINFEDLQYGAEFVQGNTTYTVIGIDIEEDTFPIVAVDKDGKQGEFTILVVKQGLLDK